MGAYGGIIEMFTRNRTGHIQVHRTGYLDKPSLYETIDGYTAIGETIQGTAGVEAWTPRVYAAGLGSVGEKSTAVQIIGVDVAREIQATRFDNKVIEGKVFAEIAVHEAVIGKGLAKILSAKVGSEIVIFRRPLMVHLRTTCIQLSGSQRVVTTQQIERRVIYTLKMHRHCLCLRDAPTKSL